MAFTVSVEKIPRSLHVDMCNLGMEMIIGQLLALTIQPTIMESIKGGQLIDPLIKKFKQKALEGKQSNFFVSKDGALGYKGGSICVPNDKEIKK